MKRPPRLSSLRAPGVAAFFLPLIACAQIPSTPFPAAEPPASTATAVAAEPAEPAPTLTKVAYGSHARQTLDFWRAPGDLPAPLVVFIHGRGWVKDDRSRPAIARYLAAGISVVVIRYRYTTDAQLAGAQPPVAWPMADAARALQFARAKAGEWNIDKTRIAVSGQSAGACTALWLAFHDDLAQPDSPDPVARESTRPVCAAVRGAQTTLDPLEMHTWTPNSRYGGHAFGFMDPRDLKTRDTRFAEFLLHRESVLSWIHEYSPIARASIDDPPVYLLYDSAPALGQPQKDPTHTANFGVKLKERLDALGVPCELHYPGVPDVRHADMDSYLIDKLKP